MKLKKGFSLRPLGNEYILLAEGAEIINFNKMLSLNESAAYLYRSLEDKDFTAETIQTLLLEEYEVSPEQAIKDAQVLIEKWQNAGIVEE